MLLDFSSLLFSSRILSRHSLPPIEIQKVQDLLSMGFIQQSEADARIAALLGNDAGNGGESSGGGVGSSGRALGSSRDALVASFEAPAALSVDQPTPPSGTLVAFVQWKADELCGDGCHSTICANCGLSYPSCVGEEHESVCARSTATVACPLAYAGCNANVKPTSIAKHLQECSYYSTMCRCVVSGESG